MSRFTLFMEGAVVVKVGGSCMDAAAPVVEEILAAGRPALVVPGGGGFADSVRALAPPDTPAHWMAVCAMEQFGWYLTSFGLPSTRSVTPPDAPAILLPYIPLLEADPLPHTWEVTSDTIAAWVAGEIGAPLVLVKSVDRLRVDGREVDLLETPVACGDVDPCLIPYLLSRRIPAVAVNGRREGRLAALLQGEEVMCTRIGCRSFIADQVQRSPTQ
ncbi:uridylate kinase [Methanofollis fontis]|uniref:Uridylate kinase n=1 Tax=Methanofollis fontis TaxID=2052832 RepID=A0A483CSJ9_9EURY|nr:uridylate kinase [Methanofollis fontis]